MTILCWIYKGVRDGGNGALGKLRRGGEDVPILLKAVGVPKRDDEGRSFAGGEQLLPIRQPVGISYRSGREKKA
jgi:hypothetical protein